MAIINLRDFYYWYTQDEFVQVSDEMAAELFAGKNSDKAHARRMRRNDVLSLDAGDGIEASAQVYSTDNPEAIFDKMDQHCRLCCALNSLPEIQGRRIEAHYILGKSQAGIVEAEGVTKGSVSISITRGLAAMKVFLENYDSQSNFCPQSDLISEG
ncbi:MAG: sigma-70 family RNA polymerase sigma factor [Oscillospiraceae bacterium]|nr:sigma-70 family RNA polymerase sigma factor [Oscillospiraceae bacterium]